METARIYTENLVFYYRPRSWEINRDQRARIYLYRCIAPSGFETIENVYCYTYKDFLALLDYWSVRGYVYKPLED
jgi:hypothetical protein